MKKFALALLVLALAYPASAAVVLTSAKGAGADANLVTISYSCTAGEEVRAFALDVNAGGKLLVGSAQAVSTEYYIYPGSIQFAVAGSGETYISNLGTPMAEQTVAGGVIEMASLYAAGDPNHPSPPPSSGALVKFRMSCPPGGPVTVKVALNTKRGGVVLKDPNVTPTVTLPADLVVCSTGPCDSMVVGQVCGGVPITQARYDAWVQIGQPTSWCHKAHFAGDVNMDCKVTSVDVIGAGGFRSCFGKSWPDPLYNAAADTNDDKRITSADILGDPSVPGGGLRPNWGKTIANCP
jgi:hypothetical protein